MKKIFSILLILFLVLSCQKETTRCLSSSIEIAFFAEQFNISQNRHKIEFYYSPNCREQLLNKNLPDIVIDWDIQDTAKFTNFKTLRGLSVNKKNIYEDLLRSGEYKGRQKLIPLAFNLPLVAYKHQKGNPEYPKWLTLDQLSQAASLHNREKNNQYQYLGFSPTWDKNSLYLAYRIFGLYFTSTAEGISVDKENLEKTELKINNWVYNLIPKIEWEETFKNKFIYTPGYKLINDRRILFYYYPSNSYFSIPEKERVNLLFSWISDGEKILADESVLYAALPQIKGNNKGGKAFLKWLLNPKVQSELIYKKNQSVLDSFGFCNGFSCLKEINNTVLPFIYPQMRQNIPKESEIDFSTESIPRLVQARDAVITEWMLNQLNQKNQLDLPTELNKWLKQKPTFE